MHWSRDAWILPNSNSVFGRVLLKVIFGGAIAFPKKNVVVRQKVECIVQKGWSLLSPSIYLYSISPSIHPSFHPNTKLSIHPTIHQNIQPFIHPSIHLLILPSPHQSIQPSNTFYLCIYPLDGCQKSQGARAIASVKGYKYDKTTSKEVMFDVGCPFPFG